MATPAALLDFWLSARVEPAGMAWLRARIDGVREKGVGPDFHLAFSTVPRKVGRTDLALTDGDRSAASDARRGWQPAFWSLDQAARALLLLSLPSPDASRYSKDLDAVFADGDLGELVAAYQALPLLPHPAAHRARAAEGIRTNMKAVFEAIALRNPYPAEQLEDAAFYQIVLKCLFVGSPLYLVDGIDGRATPALAGMLSDFAHERWAAGRPVPPELWRCVGAFADGKLLADLEKVLATGSERERAAVGLSARHNPNAEGLLVRHATAIDRALDAYPTWEHVAIDRRARATPESGE